MVMKLRTCEDHITYVMTKYLEEIHGLAVEIRSERWQCMATAFSLVA
jgi:hypothetical protein